MSLVTVHTDTVRLDRFRRYEELVRELAEAARKKKEAWHWNAHDVGFGNRGTIHFGSEVPDYAAIQSRGQVDELVRRVLGERRGNEVFAEANECLVSSRSTISMDRPDLSYPAEREEVTAPYALVTVIRARPGGQEACEELIRKIAEAIPKTDEPAKIWTLQTLVGEPTLYWTVRPLEDLRQLDRQALPADLLDKAFGRAEGGLIFRTGAQAIEHVERSIVRYREDLSNPRPS